MSLISCLYENKESQQLLINHNNKFALFAVHFKIKTCSKINIRLLSSIINKNNTLSKQLSLSLRFSSALCLMRVKPETKNVLNQGKLKKTLEKMKCLY